MSTQPHNLGQNEYLQSGGRLSVELETRETPCSLKNIFKRLKTTQKKFITSMAHYLKSLNSAYVACPSLLNSFEKR